MITLTPYSNYFTSAQTAKLLGFRYKKLANMRSMGEGPKYYGQDPRAIYTDFDIKAWAIQNVHAPRLWFERLSQFNLNETDKMYLIKKYNYYSLNIWDELYLVRETIYPNYPFNPAGPDISARNLLSIYRQDSLAFDCKWWLKDSNIASKLNAGAIKPSHSII